MSAAFQKTSGQSVATRKRRKARRAEVASPPTSSLLSEVLKASSPKSSTSSFDSRGVTIGKLVGLTDTGQALVEFTPNPLGRPLPAAATLTLGIPDVGREVVLAFVNADPGKPIILGLMQQPTAGSATKQDPVQVVMDGYRLVFTAEKEIVLRCGDASITLTKAGKVLIRGAYLLSRSSGVNRIKGGSVQIN